MLRKRGRIFYREEERSEKYRKKSFSQRRGDAKEKKRCLKINSRKFTFIRGSAPSK